MITLHGIYDNGNIIFKEKDLPKIKTEVEIIINKKEPASFKNKQYNFHKSHGKLVINSLSREDLYEDRI